MAANIKVALILSLAALVLLPLCRPLEVANYEGAEDWPELAVALRRQRIIKQDRNGFNMRRLAGATTEPEPEPEEPEPITEPEEPEPEEPEPIAEPEEPEPKPVPGVKPSPAIIMPIPTTGSTESPGSTASSAVRSRPLLSSVACSRLLLGWLC